jgi:uncharacterized protein
MATYYAPGVYVEERSTGARPIAGVSTSTAAFIGVAERGPVGRATLVTGFAEFVRRYGGPIGIAPGVREHYLHYAVRHFFEHGGTRCYVVRVAHYGNINNPATLTAVAASAQFEAQDIAGAAVANALRVSAISPGTWGTELQVAVQSTSRFQLPLAESVAAGNATGINLPPNTDVVPGTVLYLVHEITGVVASVVDDAASPNNRTVAFAGPLVQGGGTSTATIADDTPVFKPDFSVATVTDLAAGVDLNAANPPAATALRLDSVAGIAPGDALHFVVAHALVVVQSVEATVVGGNPAMRAVIADPPGIALPELPITATRVYSRDFALQVRLDDEIVEVHEDLSLVAAHATDYVNTRLGPESGTSQYIVADEPNPALADDIVMRNTVFVALGGAANDGLTDLSVADFVGSELVKNGLHALDAIEDASILVVGHSRLTTAAEPNPIVHQQNLTTATIAWLENRRDMVYLIDPPRTAGTDPVQAVRDFRGNFSSSYAGIYFPWIAIGDPLTGQRVIVPPAGAVAGIFARSDVRRGVHKAPAGLDVGLVSMATGTAHSVTKGENDVLYPENINAIRNLTEGIVVWGSRTIAADPLWQQISIRRLFIFLERSIELGTQWTVFEPNDPTLWKTIERTIRSFLRVQWLDGKLVGVTEDEAFFVRCNEETNPPDIVNAGQVVTEIGVAPSRPAEFIVFRIRQFAGRPS